MITDKQLDDIRARTPTGWTAELYDSLDDACQHVVLAWPGNGYVTIDFEKRGYRSGISISGPYTCIPGRCTGRGWRGRLVTDAVAWLQAGALAAAAWRRTNVRK